jgi:phosphatidylglycerophosphate synthase
LISKFREPTRPLRVALATPLVWLGVHPNWVTLTAIPLSAAAVLCMLQGRNGMAVSLALLAAAMDFLDGEVARLQGRVTAYGNYLEAVVDRVVDGVLLIGFMPTHPLSASLALLLGNLVSYSKARLGLVMPVDNSDWPGWGDRTDRLVLLLLAVALGPASMWSSGLMWLLVAMSATGCVQRVRYARQRIEEAGL